LQLAAMQTNKKKLKIKQFAKGAVNCDMVISSIGHMQIRYLGFT